MIKTKDNKNLNYITLTEKLSKLFSNFVNPEIIVIFICKNLYKLIEESYDLVIKYESHEELFENYDNYYQKLINNSDQLWLFTLFPVIDLDDGLKLKDFYIGIAGKITFFSEDLSLNSNQKDYRDNLADCFHWYTDTKDLSLSWKVVFHENDIDCVSMYACKFFVVDKFLQSKAEEIALYNNYYPYIIYKKRWEDGRWDNVKNQNALSQALDELIGTSYEYGYEPTYGVSLYETLYKNITKKINQYKVNVNQKEPEHIRYAGYNPVLWEVCNKILQSKKFIRDNHQKININEYGIH